MTRTRGQRPSDWASGTGSQSQGLCRPRKGSGRAAPSPGHSPTTTPPVGCTVPGHPGQRHACVTLREPDLPPAGPLGWTPVRFVAGQS